MTTPSFTTTRPHECCFGVGSPILTASSQADSTAYDVDITPSVTVIVAMAPGAGTGSGAGSSSPDATLPMIADAMSISPLLNSFAVAGRGGSTSASVALWGSVVAGSWAFARLATIAPAMHAAARAAVRFMASPKESGCTAEWSTIVRQWWRESTRKGT